MKVVIPYLLVNQAKRIKTVRGNSKVSLRNIKCFKHDISKENKKKKKNKWLTKKADSQ